MKFSKNELNDVKEILNGNQSESVKKMTKFLDEVLSDKDCDEEYDLINRDHYVASVLWQMEDIKAALEERGYATSDWNVEEIVGNINSEKMCDTEFGWEAIYQAIEQRSEYLELEEDQEDKEVMEN